MKNLARIQFRRFCSRLPREASDASASQSGQSQITNTEVRQQENPTPERIGYGLPIDEDLSTGSISSTIKSQWLNVPAQVRRTMQDSVSTSAFTNSTPQSNEPSSRLALQAQNLLRLIGKGPADLTVHRDKYCSELELIPYTKGMRSAYHWPRVLVPRTVAARVRENLMVDRVQVDKSVLLLDQVLDHTSIVLCFSGFEYSGLNTGVKAWKKLLDLTGKGAQLLNLHICEDWLSRRTHPLTRQILRSFRSEDVEPTKEDLTFIYRGKIDRDLVLDFHLYNKGLPSILLVDKKGYIRWHAVGLPTEESAEVLNRLLNKLVREK